MAIGKRTSGLVLLLVLISLGANKTFAASLSPFCTKVLEQASAGRDSNMRPEETFVVYFAPGVAAVDGNSLAVVSAAASLAQDLAATRIEVHGFTDRAGSEEANLVLAEGRADAGGRAMIEQGLDEDNVTTLAFGECVLAVPTKDGLAHRLNRRIEIMVFTP